MSNDQDRRLDARALDELFAHVCVARDEVARERCASRSFSEWTPARVGLLAALEAYAAALTSVGQPLPYRLRDELFINRQLASCQRPWPVRGPEPG